jgi:hypothetical protein
VRPYLSILLILFKMDGDNHVGRCSGEGFGR